jgi:uncharacterized protein YrzB (UPF0473 family)
MDESNELIQLVKELDKQKTFDNLTKNELYRKLLGKYAVLFHSIQDEKTNDSYITIAEMIIISNKLMEGEE